MPVTALTVHCPSCGAALHSKVAIPAGQVVRCPRCAHRFTTDPTQTGSLNATDPGQPTVAVVPDASAKKPAGKGHPDPTAVAVPPRSAPRGRTVPEQPTVDFKSGKGRRQDVEPTEIVEPEEDEDEPPPSRRTARTVRADRPHVAVVEDDEDEADDRVARRKRPRRKKKERSGSSAALWIGVGAGVLLLAAGGVVAGILLANQGKKEKDAPSKDPVAQNTNTDAGPKKDTDGVKPPPRDTQPKTDDKPKQQQPRLLPLPTGTPVSGVNVGNLAAEITGEDLNGVSFKLSDYRGKVVLLDFWGDWCPWCRKCYPHEKDLLLKLAGRPFAMLGVNTDNTRDDAKRAVQRDQLNWSSWFDGRGGAGTICQSWRITSFPQIYLIDHNGVIRKKLVGYDEAALKKLALEVDELVRDAEDAKK